MRADPTEAAALRRALQAWTIAIGYPPDVCDDIGLAVYEALANAVEHAYSGESTDPGAGDGPATLDLTAQVSAGDGLLVEVRDYGRWNAPSADPGFRGRGLTLMRELARRVEIAHHEAGTLIRMWWPAPG